MTEHIYLILQPPLFYLDALVEPWQTLDGTRHAELHKLTMLKSGVFELHMRQELKRACFQQAQDINTDSVTKHGISAVTQS